ncbi:MAG: DUF58 domain-containing protein [Bifidobacteriaceae bacterium]|jgi:uncharacterized protein (DUF58 family)|nr:DUF58 domain-containing protein [Bifidobacteriaceae bacterium]
MRPGTAVPAGVADATPWGYAAAARGRSSGDLGYSFEPPARGVYQLGPALITVPGPLGLIRVSFLASATAPLVVAPAVLPLRVPQPDSDSDRQQLRSTATAERVTDPAAVRDYQSGDPRRLVHWKATARRDRLMVRDTVTRGRPDAWILVDDTAPPGEPAEQALDLVASIAIQLLRAKHTVRLTPVSGATQPIPVEPAGGREAVLEHLARVQLGTERGRTEGAGTGGAASDGKDAVSWVRRLGADLGARGSTGPVYAAFGHVDGVLLGELGRFASMAEPAVVWLTADAAAQRDQVAAAGWLVEEAPA